jgi:hypothetical protein
MILGIAPWISWYYIYTPLLRTYNIPEILIQAYHIVQILFFYNIIMGHLVDPGVLLQNQRYDSLSDSVTELETSWKEI